MYHVCCNRQKPVFVYYPYYGWPGYPPYYMPACCPVCSMPYYQCTCKGEKTMMLPEELTVDASSPKEAFIGGNEDVNLTLEYMSDGGTPASRSVKLTITGTGGTTVWEETNITDGYHVKNDFASIPPGSMVKIEVKNCKARLRWCESVCC
ncbi:MAG: hypothetical protein AABZ11_00845 [Nitrospinota bacterium]